MPNPNPIQSEEFKAKQFQPLGEDYGKLADKNTCVRLPEAEHDAIAALGKDKTPWLRRVLVEAARAELMGKE